MSENNDISKIIKSPLQLEIYPPSQILRQVAQPVQVFNDDISILTAKMLDFMRKNNGVGLAAPQIGLSRRIFVAEYNGQSFCIINPQLTPVSSDRDVMEEGCLSLPGKAVVVRRHQQIEVRGLDITGKSLCFPLTGLFSRIFQHETDHLNGIMICDYET